MTVTDGGGWVADILRHNRKENNQLVAKYNRRPVHMDMYVSDGMGDERVKMGRMC